MFRRLHNYFAARERRSFQGRGEGRNVEEVRWWFSGERNQAICRHAGVVRIDKTTARDNPAGEMCALRENGTRRRRWLANARNNTVATIGRILMTLPALARDNRNGFIRFTYTPHDLSAFRASDRYPISRQRWTFIFIRYYYFYRSENSQSRFSDERSYSRKFFRRNFHFRGCRVALDLLIGINCKSPMLSCYFDEFKMRLVKYFENVDCCGLLVVETISVIDWRATGQLEIAGVYFRSSCRLFWNSCIAYLSMLGSLRREPTSDTHVTTRDTVYR